MATWARATLAVVRRHRWGFLATGAVTAALLLVGVAALTLLPRVNPQATRPCAEDFADRLGEDPLLAVRAPGDVSSRGGDGYCEDSDGGGVSYVEQDRVTNASDEAVARYFAAEVTDLGWEHVRVTRNRDAADAYYGAGVCADRLVDGHSLNLNLVFTERAGLPPGQREYKLSITGDSGAVPDCIGG